MNHFKKLIKSGKLSNNDHIINKIRLSTNPDDTPLVLYVDNYIDREELQGKGIGKSYYQNLQEFARSLGYRFISGSNSPKNINFFVQTLGRSLLEDIDPEKAMLLHPYPTQVKKDLETVDFLYPEDKLTYLKVADK
ncbi:hypothetical protein BH09PAT1_BH09PAT1_5900 [soil metagenome]